MASASSKKYPSRCVECGKLEVRPASLKHAMQKKHDGRAYDLLIEKLPVVRCNACGEVYFTHLSDDRISAALREKLRLLKPDDILANLNRLGMRQKQLAKCLGVAEETLSRWVTGTMIQSRAMDNLLRAYFGCAEVRANLTGEPTSSHFGQDVSPTFETTHH